MTSTALSDYRLLGRSGLRVSPLALGGASFGEEWGWGAGREECQRIFDLYVDHGGNFIDNSNIYNDGTSESWLGDFMGPKRQRLVISTKYSMSTDPTDPNAGGNHRKSMVRAVEDSLKRLRTDYIDVYMLHAWEYRTPIDEVMRGYEDLVRAGKILYAGMSNAPAWIATQAQCLADRHGWSPLINLQTEYNLINRTAELDLVPMAIALGLGISAWAPTAGGLLARNYRRDDSAHVPAASSGPITREEFVRSQLNDRNLAIADTVGAIAQDIGCKPSQVALRWLIDRPGVCSPIIGCRTVEHLLDNMRCCEINLTDEQVARLDDISAPGGDVVPYNIIRRPIITDQVSGGLTIEQG